MSTSAVSSVSLNQQLQSYFQTRHTDVQQLGQALSSGNLANAQVAYNSIAALGQEGPFAKGNPFQLSQREQDFTAIGQALQSGIWLAHSRHLVRSRRLFAGILLRGRPHSRFPAPLLVLQPLAGAAQVRKSC